MYILYLLDWCTQSKGDRRFCHPDESVWNCRQDTSADAQRDCPWPRPSHSPRTVYNASVCYSLYSILTTPVCSHNRSSSIYTAFPLLCIMRIDAHKLMVAGLFDTIVSKHPIKIYFHNGAWSLEMQWYKPNL